MKTILAAIGLLLCGCLLCFGGCCCYCLADVPVADVANPEWNPFKPAPVLPNVQPEAGTLSILRDAMTSLVLVGHKLNALLVGVALLLLGQLVLFVLQVIALFRGK